MTLQFIFQVRKFGLWNLSTLPQVTWLFKATAKNQT